MTRNSSSMFLRTTEWCERTCEVTHQVDAIHDADTKRHERLGEVDHLFTLGRNGQACHCQVSFLKGR